MVLPFRHGGIHQACSDRYTVRGIDPNQDDLAQAIGAAGAHQISRYEAGKITPNTDTMIRIAETFNVSLDYLLIDDAPRRPLHAPTTGIDHRLEAIAQLSPEDTTALSNVIDAFTTRTRLRLITN